MKVIEVMEKVKPWETAIKVGLKVREIWTEKLTRMG